eukprot:756399-Hanusia_phi.AAC.4
MQHISFNATRIIPSPLDGTEPSSSQLVAEKTIDCLRWESIVLLTSTVGRGKEEGVGDDQGWVIEIRSGPTWGL